MRVAFVTPEMAPFVKTGGLGDVAAALSQARRFLFRSVPFLPTANSYALDAASTPCS